MKLKHFIIAPISIAIACLIVIGIGTVSCNGTNNTVEAMDSYRYAKELLHLSADALRDINYDEEVIQVLSDTWIAIDKLDHPELYPEEVVEDLQPISTQSEIEESQRSYVGEFICTAYCNCSICCGKWAGGATASGAYPTSNHTIAVDPKVIPLGTTVYIDGNAYVAEDTGSAIKGNRIDIYFDSHSAALDFGRRTKSVYK